MQYATLLRLHSSRQPPLPPLSRRRNTCGCACGNPHARPGRKTLEGGSAALMTMHALRQHHCGRLRPPVNPEPRGDCPLRPAQARPRQPYSYARIGVADPRFRPGPGAQRYPRQPPLERRDLRDSDLRTAAWAVPEVSTACRRQADGLHAYRAAIASALALTRPPPTRIRRRRASSIVHTSSASCLSGGSTSSSARPSRPRPRP